jgi:hypothetical protein
VSFLVNYTQVAVGSVLLLIVGVVLLAFSSTVVIPGPYRTFLGIPYETNPEYALALVLKGGLIIFGIVFLVSAPLYALLQIGFSKPPMPPPPLSHVTFCPYCGMQNKHDAVFCSKCGKRIAD